MIQDSFFSAVTYFSTSFGNSPGTSGTFFWNLSCTSGTILVLIPVLELFLVTISGTSSCTSSATSSCTSRNFFQYYWYFWIFFGYFLELELVQVLLLVFLLVLLLMLLILLLVLLLVPVVLPGQRGRWRWRSRFRFSRTWTCSRSSTTSRLVFAWWLDVSSGTDFKSLIFLARTQ